MGHICMGVREWGQLGNQLLGIWESGGLSDSLICYFSALSVIFHFQSLKVSR